MVASLDRFRKIGLAAILLNGVDTMEASGPLEVTVKLKKVQSNFLDTLSSPGTPLAIYPAEEAGKDPKDFKFIGTGPMKFVEYAPDSHATLERFADYVPNPNYTKRDGFAGRKEMFIDRAVFRFMPESGARTAAIKTGEVLINETTDGPTAKQLAGDSQRAGAEAAAVRAADRQIQSRAGAVRRREFPARGAGVPQHGRDDGDRLSRHLQAGWRVGVRLLAVLLEGRAPSCTTSNNQAKAKEWLAKSSYKGETLTFIIDNTRPDVDTATDIKEQLGQIGIKIDVKVSDWPTVSTLGFTPNGWHFWTHGLGIEPYEGPAKLMSIWANGISQIKDDPNIDKMYADLLAELDMDKRKAIFAEFQKYMYDNAVDGGARQLRDVPGGIVEAQEFRAVSHPAPVGRHGWTTLIAATRRPLIAALHRPAAADLGAGAGAGVADVVRGDLAGAGRSRGDVPRRQRDAGAARAGAPPARPGSSRSICR